MSRHVCSNPPPLFGYSNIMARPIKNSCEYFPHDKDMRNHKKIKAIRNKFGITGYAVWSMLLELLTGSDGNTIEDSEIEIELISGDFGVSVTEIRKIIDYCYKLELLFNDNGFIYSESLNYNLAPVYKKRGTQKGLSAKQNRVLGKFSKNTVSGVVSVTETTDIEELSISEKPYSKVEYSKVNNTIGGNGEILKPDPYTVNKMIAFTIKPYAAHDKEFLKTVNEDDYIGYQWFVKLYTDNVSHFNRLHLHPEQVTFVQYKDILKKYTDDEIVNGLQGLAARGIKPTADMVWAIVEYIGYYREKQNRNTVKSDKKQQNSASYTSDAAKFSKQYD